MAHDPRPVERVHIIAYTPQVWVRGLVELRGATRLTDLLNHGGTPVVALLDGDMLPIGTTEWPAAARPLVVNKAELLLLYPTSDGNSVMGAAGLNAHRFSLEVGMHLDQYHVQGIIHLPDVLPWAQYFSVLRDRFLSLTQATIRRASDGQQLAAADYVVVNRERLSVLYQP